MCMEFMVAEWGYLPKEAACNVAYTVIYYNQAATKLGWCLLIRIVATATLYYGSHKHSIVVATSLEDKKFKKFKFKW